MTQSVSDKASHLTVMYDAIQTHEALAGSGSPRATVDPLDQRLELLATLVETGQELSPSLNLLVRQIENWHAWLYGHGSRYDHNRNRVAPSQRTGVAAAVRQFQAAVTYFAGHPEAKAHNGVQRAGVQSYLARIARKAARAHAATAAR